jgi:hypothetical protein
VDVNYRLVIVSSDPDFIASNLPLEIGQEVVASDVNADINEFTETIVDLGALPVLTDLQVAFLRRESVNVVMCWTVEAAENVLFVDPVIDLVAWARETFAKSSNVFLRYPVQPGYGRVLPVEQTQSAVDEVMA